MKIAVNTRFLLKGRIEGMGLFTHEVLKRLVSQHPDDEFIFFFDRPFDAAFVYGPNVKPVVLHPPARHPFLFIAWFEWSVARALRKFRPDVFLSPDNFLTLRTTVPTVLVTHDLAHVHFPDQISFLQRKYYQWFVPSFNEKATRIVTVSDFTKSDLVTQYGIDPGKISVACNGSPEGFVPLDKEEIRRVRDEYTDGEPYFFYVGAVHPRKNVHRLIEAFDRFKTATGAGAKLLIAGRFAWQAGAVKKAYDRSACQPDIRFLGYVDDATLQQLMGAAVCCVYVSLFEGFGIPILLAMQCEVPVITSNVSSMPEVAGDAALCVDPLSVDAIGEAMRQIWDNPHLLSTLVAAGKKQRKQFTWQRAAEVVYENLKVAAEK